MRKSGEILIIIPAYNEERNIQRVVEELREKTPQVDYVIVNDGSRDATGQICRENGYRMLDLPVNLGLSGAVRTGMLYAVRHQYSMALQFDGDGQHRPEYIEELADCIRQGEEIAIGSRFLTEKKPFTARMIGSRVLTSLIRHASGHTLTDPTSGMRMYSRSMLERFASNANLRPEPDSISFLIRSGVRVRECQVSMRERVAGSSYLTAFRSISYMLRMVFSITIIQGLRGKGETK